MKHHIIINKKNASSLKCAIYQNEKRRTHYSPLSKEHRLIFGTWAQHKTFKKSVGLQRRQTTVKVNVTLINS